MDRIRNLEAAPAATGRPRLRDRLVLWLHAQAERLDRVPADFASAIDTTDAHAVRGEWIRLARLWADHNPEELLAWKAGVAVLGGALLVLVIVVRAMG